MATGRIGCRCGPSYAQATVLEQDSPVPTASGQHWSGGLGPAAAEDLQALGQDLLEVRGSMSMSQCVRAGLTRFASGSAPSISRAVVPSYLHSQVSGISASSAKGTAKVCPFGHRYSAGLRGASSALRS